MTLGPIKAGYRIDRIHVAQQQYELVDDVEGLVDGSERTINFGWDWRPIRPRTFEVIIRISLEPTKPTPERVSVRLVGTFTAEESEPSISFPSFVKANAVAILYPFAREAISAMTGRGPLGEFHLDPMNVTVLMSAFDLSRSAGALFLDQHPEIASDFGLAYQEPAVDPVASSLTQEADPVAHEEH